MDLRNSKNVSRKAYKVTQKKSDHELQRAYTRLNRTVSTVLTMIVYVYTNNTA